MSSLRRATLFAITALAVAASATDVATALREPDGRWLELGTKHVTIFTDAGESRGRTMALQLERLRLVLSGVAPGLRQDSSRPVYVYVFGEEKSFRAYARKQSVSRKVEGLSFEGADASFVMVNAAAGGGALGVVYHEYLHRLLTDSFPGMPLWLNEGLAEFFSTFWTNGYQAEIGAPIADYLDLLRKSGLIPLDRLLAATPRSEEYTRATIKPRFHAQAWLLTHYMIEGDPAPGGGISRYLRQAGADPDAFESTFGVDATTLESRLSAYLLRDFLPTSDIDFAEPLPEAWIEIEEMTEQDVHYRLGVLLANGLPGGRRMAEKHLERALAIDPDHAGALGALAALRSGAEFP
jgi:hypothetical protein